MSTRLGVRFCNIELENPCILASASPTQSKEGIAKAFKLGWAGVSTKTCASNYLLTNESPNRFGVIRGTDEDILGFANFEGITRKPSEYWEKTIRELKSEFPNKVVIASIIAEVNREPWQNLAMRMEKAGADALEINLSCPHFRLDNAMGAAVGKDVENSAQIISWVKKVVRIPIIAKLTPNISYIQNMAKAVVEAGTDAIAAINTTQGLIGINIDTFEPLPTVDGHSTLGGYSGRAIKPIALRCVAQIAQAVNVPIIGIGGISKWQDIIEHYAVGSSSVQICTEVMLSGYQIITSLLKGLEEYVEKKNIINLLDITGKAVPKIIAREKLNMLWPVRAAVINPDKCTKCAKCLISCSESGQAAIQFIDGEISINNEICDGCSLCIHVCPYGVLKLQKSHTKINNI